MEVHRTKEEVQFIDAINNLIFLTPVADAETIKQYHAPIVYLIDNSPYIKRGEMGHKSLHQNMWAIRCGAHNGCAEYNTDSGIYLVDRNKAMAKFMSQEGDDGRLEKFGTEQLRFNVWYDQTYIDANAQDNFSKNELKSTSEKVRAVLHKDLEDAVVIIA